MVIFQFLIFYGNLELTANMVVRRIGQHKTTKHSTFDLAGVRGCVLEHALAESLERSLLLHCFLIASKVEHKEEGRDVRCRKVTCCLITMIVVFRSTLLHVALHISNFSSLWR